MGVLSIVRVVGGQFGREWWLGRGVYFSVETGHFCNLAADTYNRGGW